MKLAIIPARGGSKRIPRKNIKEFYGKPMIAWAIRAAIKSKCFDRIIVSTDDEEIAQTAMLFGAEVPFLRPAILSDDHTPTAPVIAHTISEIEKSGNQISLACCIYATVPFIQPKDLVAGLNLMETSRWDFAFGATSFGYPIFRSFEKLKDGAVKMFYPEHFNTRSQDLPEAWHDAGQFYWGRVQAWKKEALIFNKRSTIVPIPRFRVQDIDTQEDWERSEKLAKVLFGGKDYEDIWN